MNRFEQAVYQSHAADSQAPRRDDKSTPSRHASQLLRHVHLEGAGEYEAIVATDMMVDEPVYRVTWGADPAVIEGKDAVLAFYERR